MKILITGASGFIGSKIFKYFNDKNFNVYGLIRRKTSINYLKKNNKKLILCDLNDFNKLDKLIPKKIDIIIHAGAYNDQDTNKDIKNAYITNVFGTRNICRIAESRKVKKVIYFSVLQVYGRELKNNIKESSKIICDNDYSLSHYLAENVCSNYAELTTIKFIILRLGYMFGCPIDSKIDRKTLIPYVFCDQAAKLKKISLMSKGKARRDFVSITKLCQNINKLIKIKSRNLDRYNFTSGYSFSMSDIAKIVSEEAKNLFKSNIPIFYSNKYKDKVNSFKVSSKLKIYKNKKILDQELRDEIKKILLILNEN